MPKTYDRRLADIEAAFDGLQSQFSVLKDAIGIDCEWVPLADAAIFVGRSERQLRYAIQKSMLDPNEPFQRGVHWRRGKRYEINVERWKKTLEQL